MFKMSTLPTISLERQIFLQNPFKVVLYRVVNIPFKDYGSLRKGYWRSARNNINLTLQHLMD